MSELPKPDLVYCSNEERYLASSIWKILKGTGYNSQKAMMFWRVVKEVYVGVGNATSKVGIKYDSVKAIGHARASMGSTSRSVAASVSCWTPGASVVGELMKWRNM